MDAARGETIPMQTPQALPPQTVPNAHAAKAAPKHIVLLDDDEATLRGVSRLLTAAGFRVTATLNPREAMERVVCDGADAIISDLHMPEMGGNLVLAMLTQAAPRVARLLLTSETDFSRVASLAVPYSVHAFVSKREVTSRLIPTLRELLAGRPDVDPAAISEEARGLAHSIVRALALRDYETELHCNRVAAFARRLGSELGLSPSRVLDVELGALLHDIGKIGVRDAVLLKPGALNEAEWIEMRKHPDLGVALLCDVPALRRAIPVVQCHHERRDGKGYPRQLSGNAIPLDARIFQVVDTYDAIVSDRPYRKGRTDLEAREEIAKHVGPQFDPEVFEAFRRIDVEDWKSVTHHLR
jgi:response regulator RpfG family c-di-GMP phosphodiesterase